MNVTTQPLGEIVEFRGGGTPSKSRPEFYEDGSIPWVTPKDMKSWIINSSLDRITGDAVDQSAAKLIPASSVLVVIRSGVLKHTLPVGINQISVTVNQDMKALVCSKVVDPFYLGRFLRASAPSLLTNVRGTTADNISTNVLKDLAVPLPPLAEQKRIAAILDAADALRAKRRESLAQLDTLVQSTFLDMFGDPVTNPMGFPLRALAEFYASKRDATKCGPFGSALKKNELVPSGVPVWNMDNIDPAGRMVLPFRMWITEEKYRQLEAYSVLDGDVIISRAGTVGKMCVAESGYAASIISTNLIRVRFGVELLPVYFVSLMTYCKGRVGRLKTGPDGSFTHMSTGILDKLKFPYPPIELQRRFATIVESVERQKPSLRAHLTELDTLFASLQARAFCGNL